MAALRLAARRKPPNCPVSVDLENGHGPEPHHAAQRYYPGRRGWRLAGGSIEDYDRGGHAV